MQQEAEWAEQAVSSLVRAPRCSVRHPAKSNRGHLVTQYWICYYFHCKFGHNCISFNRSFLFCITFGIKDVIIFSTDLIVHNFLYSSIICFSSVWKWFTKNSLETQAVFLKSCKFIKKKKKKSLLVLSESLQSPKRKSLHLKGWDQQIFSIFVNDF